MAAVADTACRVLVFARAPVPGRAKTRLIPRIGPEGAAELQARFITDAVLRATGAKVGPVELWCTPDARHPLFTRLAREHGLALHAQPAGDLGERMAHASERTLDTGGHPLLIGTDTPLLGAEDIAAAATALASHDAVITPAEDGGYVLLGLRRFHPRLFADIVWSTGTVYAETCARLDGLGWSWQALPARPDVDCPEDLDRLARARPALVASLV